MTSRPDESRLLEAETRITELEVRHAHQQKELSELSDVLFQQQKLIDKLSRRVEALEKKLVDAEAPSPRDPKDEVPPHY